MINLLRNIRKNLFAQDHLKKYIFYAFGEIFLVMIGILLALQVNNWNNDRLDARKEREILLELKDGLLGDAIKLDSALQIHSYDIKLAQQLDSLLKNPEQAYFSEMDRLFGAVYGIRFVRLNHAYFEDLKSNGFQLIKNPEIRKSLVNLFEDTFVMLDNYLVSERSVNQVTRPYYLENFINIDFYKSATPINYQKLWNDPYYKNVVHYRIISLEANQIDNYQKCILEIERIVDRIDKYLNR